MSNPIGACFFIRDLFLWISLRGSSITALISWSIISLNSRHFFVLARVYRFSEKRNFLSLAFWGSFFLDENIESRVRFSCYKCNVYIRHGTSVMNTNEILVQATDIYKRFKVTQWWSRDRTCRCIGYKSIDDWIVGVNLALFKSATSSTWSRWSSFWDWNKFAISIDVFIGTSWKFTGLEKRAIVNFLIH